MKYARRWWQRLSLRARLTLVATVLFSLAVATGAVLLIWLQHYALTQVLDSSAEKTASDIATQFLDGKGSANVLPTTGGILFVQVLDAAGDVIAASPGADRVTPVLMPTQVAAARSGTRLEIDSTTSAERWRIVAEPAGDDTVLVVTDLARVDDTQRLLTGAALVGGPIAVLLMAIASYVVAALALRPVAELRHGAADITAGGLADKRLPVPDARDEIHHLAVTLNAMLDRIDSATKRQRTFVGDAAHELRSPLASLRVQLEVAERLGPDSDWQAQFADIIIDVDRLDRLVTDLLTLARLDESGSTLRTESVEVVTLARSVVDGYANARVRVRVAGHRAVYIDADTDGLRRILINLVDNAVRHASTSVIVAVTPDRVAGRGVVRMTITDDGPGLAEEERERVFDRFYRVESSRWRESGGSGLGLPIVRDLVRAHGGTVRLLPRPDGASGLQALVILPTEPPPTTVLE